MLTESRMRIVFHGAAVLLVGLLCGLPTTTEHEPMRLWHTAHEALIMIGTLMIALSSAMPLLALEAREARALVWALLGMGYGLMGGVTLQAIGGQSAIGPSSSPLLMIAFLFNVVGILGSVLSASLTMIGANPARRAAAAETARS